MGIMREREKVTEGGRGDSKVKYVCRLYRFANTLATVLNQLTNEFCTFP
jgi:hypothetical protein